MKPEAYKGQKPYIFLSYSHKDYTRAEEIITSLQKEGFRVWYDDGIDPGTEWDDYIADRIVNCGYFMALISTNYLESDNCKDELNFARNRIENRLLVYLEEVTLPPAIEMRLGRTQAVNYYSFRNNPEGFIKKIISASGILKTKDETVNDAVVGLGKTEKPECKPLKKENFTFPGFRSGKLYKKVLASVFYVISLMMVTLMIYEMLFQNYPVNDGLFLIIFMCIWPLGHIFIQCNYLDIRKRFRIETAAHLVMFHCTWFILCIILSFSLIMDIRR